MFARKATDDESVVTSMAAIPANVETDKQPPMSVPFRHFVVGLAFLLGGGLVGLLAPFGALPGQAMLVHLHLLLAGWVCITIMGAMTQFVPVWSGTTLHSERLSALQLWLVTAGLFGFATSLLLGLYELLPVFGGTMLAGFWMFVYNVGRTLLGSRPWDVTERHFAVALGFVLVLTVFGLLLALGYTHPILAGLPFDRTDLRTAHATLAVFGAVLTTVFGALYQLGTMFTQSDLRGIDMPLKRVEEIGYPVGVVVLATGRLFESSTMAHIGALLVVAGLFAFGIILARRLTGATVEWNPMLRRYAVVAASMIAWASLTVPVWIADPLSSESLFGAPSAMYLLLFGVIGFVVLGTLYHIVPFIIWVHRYSDMLGLADVPMIDDLYDDRLATVDFVALLSGFALLVIAEPLSLPRAVTALGGTLSLVGFVVFVGNIVMVIRNHGPSSVSSILLPQVSGQVGDSDEQPLDAPE
ncbi:hypothetical protein ELS19_16620 [Halogeometricum borinquense]|uniref:Cbb3-type cytochrome c oxidase subunit I n=1 Tax=Halogeometricum borinquense TaxID=60847 RepID=A0A482T0P8_9EURY|nr:hypothetical protein [Halogeometricum borinquense]RYJ08190.1 hypothetical protein ELS19_16620 [Halogeometricum borinquense]